MAGRISAIRHYERSAAKALETGLTLSLHGLVFDILVLALPWRPNRPLIEDLALTQKAVIDGHVATSGSTGMTPRELADRLAALDEDAFVAALQLEYSHDDEPGQVKAMMIDALRFADAHGMKAPQPPLDQAD